MVGCNLKHDTVRSKRYDTITGMSSSDMEAAYIYGVGTYSTQPIYGQANTEKADEDEKVNVLEVLLGGGE